ncbi:hypothetical protein FRC12_006876 [Ceratobasidium sp. 428]|nr:hypothetical protein FRC12_006876 [Ceratobasidium sp. 428]
MAPLAPSPRGSYQSPNDFLAAIGRSSDTKLKAETWDDLWRMRGEDMKKAGLTPAERRQAVEYPHRNSVKDTIPQLLPSKRGQKRLSVGGDLECKMVKEFDEYRRNIPYLAVLSFKCTHSIVNIRDLALKDSYNSYGCRKFDLVCSRQFAVCGRQSPV